MGATQPHSQWVQGSFPGVKRTARKVDNTPPFCAVIILGAEWRSKETETDGRTVYISTVDTTSKRSVFIINIRNIV
jgi:hypothetical protein